MALINCPSCKKRISSKALTCSHCGFNRELRQSSDGESEQKLAAQAKLNRLRMRYSLQMQAMAGIILFLAGSMLWYFSGRNLNSWQQFAWLSMAAGGAIWYLVTRVRQAIFKKAR